MIFEFVLDDYFDVFRNNDWLFQINIKQQR